jgi:hypothetical protein
MLKVQHETDRTSTFELVRVRREAVLEYSACLLSTVLPAIMRLLNLQDKGRTEQQQHTHGMATTVASPQKGNAAFHANRHLSRNFSS